LLRPVKKNLREERGRGGCPGGPVNLLRGRGRISWMRRVARKSQELTGEVENLGKKGKRGKEAAVVSRGKEAGQKEYSWEIKKKQMVQSLVGLE